METISRLGRRFGLSRSTLLYYDRLGLLRAQARSAAGYRRYGAEAARRLELICLYRSAGVPLAQVKALLDGPAHQGAAAILEARLVALQAEAARIRAQQDVILKLLARPELARRFRGLDKDGWVAVLRSAGLDDAAMWRWHAEFERAAPEAHAELLAALRIPAPDVARIRRAARAAAIGATRRGSSIGSASRAPPRLRGG
jgi:DNA-binding transcriptional MerR regulator